MSDFGRTSALSGWRRLPANLVAAIGRRLFRHDDVRARQCGWQVTSGRGGMNRTYRDPRFDRLARCPVCLGTGTVRRDTYCDHCSRTGRITLPKSCRRSSGSGPR